MQATESTPSFSWRSQYAPLPLQLAGILPASSLDAKLHVVNEDGKAARERALGFQPSPTCNYRGRGTRAEEPRWLPASDSAGKT